MARHAIGGGREGYERLKVLHRSRWRDTAELFERIGVAPACDASIWAAEAARSPSSTLVAGPRIFQLRRRQEN